MGQIPGILQTIRYERSWLQQAVRAFAFDAVVSDNRFGLHHPDIPCVYLTHQLRIKIPGGGPIEGLLQRLHYRFIRHYSACWVPDLAGKPNLSGDLGHPRRLPGVPLHYLGPLSRLEKKGAREQNPLLILLSGPEPQRTLFEEQILHQIDTVPGPMILIRGLPGAPPADHLAVPGKLVVYNHAPAALLQELLAASSMVLSRTGYTTVMDMVRLQKKSILIPTPGQTEQEYLGTYLRAQGIAYTTPQTGFNLRKALEEAAAFPYRFPPFDEDAFKAVAGPWLTHIRGLKG
jgi:UDP-N-acetylglucosamine transferase subunit ALG13